MKVAFSLATSAKNLDEVPVGAVIVKDNAIVSTGLNLRQTSHQTSGHAEFLAVQKANKILKSWRLQGCTLYVPLEPCIMCSGLLYQSRIDRVVFGAFDPKAGAMGSLYDIHTDQRLNHQIDTTPLILQKECSDILTSFFRQKRRKKPPT